MKKIYLFIAVLATYGLNAQYTQNFDTLTVGDYIGVEDPNWTTWSGTVGTTEDAQVDATQASSGNNSIYFNSTVATGGPQDVVLEFGAAHNTGDFVYEHDLYIPSGKGAYFNFQAEAVIGTTWALDCQFTQDSIMYVSHQSNQVIKVPFPMDTWFTFKLEVNLNTNLWEVFLDGVSQGSFQNDENQVASIDIYPTNSTTLGGNNLATFWIDDVSFSHTPFTLPAVNASAYYIDLGNVTIVGASNTPVVQIKNLGTTTITSFDLAVDYNGSQITETVTNVSIPSMGTYDVEMSAGIMISSNSNTITATVSNVNGLGADGHPADDSKTISFKPIVPAAGKMVIVEEATGTWCGWCPRGTVAMDFLARDYHGFAQGIAVHNGDPMVNAVYDGGIGAFISGYPSALVDRGTDIDPSAIWEDVNNNLTEAPTAFLVNGAKIDSVTGDLHVSITADFKAAASSGWKLACVLTEDSVTGTASNYGQTNYYAGGGNGDLFAPDGTNWATLPATVPASQMMYHHVGRAISPSFTGEPKSFPAVVNANDVHTLNFWFPIDPSWNIENMHIAGMLIKPNGQIDNGSGTTVAEAISNGFVSGTNVSITQILLGPDAKVRLFPNPTQSGYTNIQVNHNTSTIEISVMNMAGKEVFANTYTNRNSEDLIELNTQNWAEGVYIVNVKGEDFTESHRLIVE